MIAIVAAHAQNRAIGKDGRIPWNIAGEQKRFRELTTGHVVVMGRKTYEEIGRPLPNRTTVVLSRTKNFNAENCITAATLSEALQLAGNRDVYIAGGEKVYKEALPLAEKLYLTEIGCTVEGDAFFPVFDESQFSKETVRTVPGEIPYTYVTYTRK